MFSTKKRSKRTVKAWAIFVNGVLRLDLINATEDFAIAVSKSLETAYRGKLRVQRVEISWEEER